MKMEVCRAPLLSWLVVVIVVVIGFFDIHTQPTTITTTMFVETGMVGSAAWMPSRWMLVAVSSGLLFDVQLTVCFSA
jgi:hypothetical protein